MAISVPEKVREKILTQIPLGWFAGPELAGVYLSSITLDT